MDFVTIVHTVINLTMLMLFLWSERLHKKEIDEVHRSYKEERAALLDRIMANNIHEYKSLSEKIPAKKSETGNFLVDRMNKTIKNQFSDLE